MRLKALLDMVRPAEGARGVAYFGYAIIFLTFIVLGVWASLAPLDSAVIAHGVVTTEGSRKTIQHLEGGIVREINVKEGDAVRAGQVLFRLDPTQATASVDITQNQLFALLAQEARLTAERDQSPVVRFPPELTARMGDPIVSRAIADEQNQFIERRNTISGQVDLLTARMEQFRTEIEGLDRERASREQQVGYLNEEITGLTELFEKGLVPKPRLLAMERERSSLQGQIGRSIADRSKAEKGIGEASLQIRQIRQQFYEEVSKEISEVRVKMSDLRERVTVSSDTLSRVNITSPATGVVQNLRIFTVGAVVRPGEPMVDIAPTNDGLTIHAQFSPQDVDNIAVGMDTEVRFPSFHSRTIPMITGRIHSISRDRLVDEATKQPYFLAVVMVDQTQLPQAIRPRLNAGLPAEVVVPTGERTVLEYIFQPLTSALRKSGIEE